MPERDTGAGSKLFRVDGKGVEGVDGLVNMLERILVDAWGDRAILWRGL